MSYAADSARKRPGVVTVAAILLFITAAALIGEAIVMFSQIGPVGSQLKPLYPPAEFGDPDSGLAVARGVFGVPAAGALIFAVVFGVLGALDLAGKNWARICTWIFGSLGMLCCGCTSALYAGLGLSNLAAQVQSKSGPNPAEPGPTTEEFMNAIDQAVPGWYTAALLILGTVVVLSVLTAVILVSLPAAGEYFRKPPLMWVPPTAPGPQPGTWSGYGPPPTNLPGPPATNLPDPPATGLPDRPASPPSGQSDPGEPKP
jgi:hypothetical protein